MSTRCHIGIYRSKDRDFDEFDVLLYRHNAGYPGRSEGEGPGVLIDIVPFLTKWAKIRGIKDTDYCGARLLQYLCNKFDRAILRGKYRKHINFLDETIHKNSGAGVLGHGISRDFYTDIVYFYKVYPNAIEVYSPKFDSESQPVFDKWRLIQTVKLV